MSDLFSFDLADGFASGNCPICHAVALDERRWIDSFWREGRRDRATRRRFYAAGGFCGSHAWLLHQLVVDADAGSAISDVYGGLAAHDLSELDALISRGFPGRRKGGGAVLPRAGECSACVAGADALERKVHFFLDLLGNPAGRERYEGSAGLCLIHLQAAVSAAADNGTALYLVENWRSRLATAREQLAEFDRTRAGRHAGSRTEDARRPLTEVIRLYAGGPPTAAHPRFDTVHDPR